MENVGIIGLGEIGEAVIRNMHIKKIDNIYGVDINEDKVSKLKEEGFNVDTKLPKAMDVYIIAVYSTDQVMSVIKSLDYSKCPLVLIESTLQPGTAKKIKEFKGRKFQLAIFPHRYFAPDPQHQVFNLKRVLGGENTQVTLRAMNFLKKYIDLNLVYTKDVTMEVAELCKPLENAYRFMEITMAEAFAMYCDKKGIDSEALRGAMNSKWNINVLEPRDGVGGHCLPKDIKLVSDFFKNNTLFKTMISINEEYKTWKKKKSNKKQSQKQ